MPVHVLVVVLVVAAELEFVVSAASARRGSCSRVYRCYSVGADSVGELVAVAGAATDVAVELVAVFVAADAHAAD